MNNQHIKNITDKQISKNASLTSTRKVSQLSSNQTKREREFTKLDEEVVSTKKYLDKAINLARETVSSNHRPPALTKTSWLYQLTGQYEQCRFYPPLIKEAARRFKQKGHIILATWAMEKDKEERGHHLLALKDFEELGGKPEVLKEVCPPTAKALREHLNGIVKGSSLIGVVGYSYTLERLSVCVGEDYIKKVEALLPPGIHATRCLRVHSSLGADVKHLEETTRMIASLTSKERKHIAIACYETALLCFSPPKEGYISDEQIQELLEPQKLRTSL